MYDAVIIGGGVTGCSVARELSRYHGKFCLIEKEEDVCCGTSKANSAIVHAGYDAEPGTLKAKLNVEGNMLMEPLSHELNFPFRRIGSLVVFMNKEEESVIHELFERGRKNGVPGLRLIDRKELLFMEPGISPEAGGALLAPSGGIVCPFLLTIALAENAAVNGMEFRFNEEVTAIQKAEKNYEVNTSVGKIQCRMVINAAGVYADKFHNMVSKKKIHITPRRGEYILLDHASSGIVRHTIFQAPTIAGKGVLVTPTVHENVLTGPTALFIENREGNNTTQAGLDQIMHDSLRAVPDIPFRQVITSFSGLRASEERGDFVIEEPEDAPGFLDCAGIDSPGLSSAPAIGKMVAKMIAEDLSLKEKMSFIREREAIPDPKAMSIKERNLLIRKKPAYGNIICRCEGISEGEILEAIHRVPGAKSLDGVKRRVRAGMGRCQAGFCSTRVMDILERELKMSPGEITKCGGASVLVMGKNKEAYSKWKSTTL